MNEPNNILSDSEFISFLQNLGVETFDKSYEWLLGDPDYAGVLRWIYNNLDENNALTAREEYRYAEVEKQGKVLTSEDLEAELHEIQDEYKGICLPGDQDGLEDLKLDIKMQKEKLAMLNKQEEVLKELIKQNEATNQELNVELTKLNAAQKQAANDEKAAGEECVKLAKQLQAVTDDVIDTVADALHVYGNCAVDKELAKRFFTYGPFESYKQTQELFRSHFDLYTSLKFDKHNGDTTNDDIRKAVKEAKNIEDRLSDAVTEYIESKAELCGQRAKLVLINSYYDSGHSNQYQEGSLEIHKSAIKLLEQEESILEQQIQNATKRFVERRTNLTVENIAKTVLAAREQIYKDLLFLQDVFSRAVALDRLLYRALRRELHSAEQLLYFASHLREYLLQETESVADRIKSMHDICSEQEAAEKNLEHSDVILRSLFAVLDLEPGSDSLAPVQLYSDMQRDILQLKDDIQYGCRMKEEALDEIKNQAKPLRKYLWDGCINRPNCHDRGVSALNHALTHQMGSVDAKLHGLGDSFTSVRNGDAQNLRKLWQWFLTDPVKFSAAIKHLPN